MQFCELTKEKIKIIKSLHKKTGREEHGLFLAEGVKICSEISGSLYKPEYIMVPGNAKDESKILADDLSKKFRIHIYKAPRKLFDSLCDTESPQDILVILKISKNQPDVDKSFIGLDNVADPGNVGTIIRTARWFGFEQIILNDGCADIYNPKTLRSSMGAILKQRCVITNDLKKTIKDNFSHHKIYGTVLEGNNDISNIKSNEKIGIIFGNESTGISSKLMSVIDEKVKIEGFGDFDSLNVAVAAGIVMYELSVKK